MDDSFIEQLQELSELHENQKHQLNIEKKRLDEVESKLLKEKAELEKLKIENSYLVGSIGTIGNEIYRINKNSEMLQNQCERLSHENIKIEQIMESKKNEALQRKLLVEESNRILRNKVSTLIEESNHIKSLKLKRNQLNEIIRTNTEILEKLNSQEIVDPKVEDQVEINKKLELERTELRSKLDKLRSLSNEKNRKMVELREENDKMKAKLSEEENEFQKLAKMSQDSYILSAQLEKECLAPKEKPRFTYPSHSMKK